MFEEVMTLILAVSCLASLLFLSIYRRKMNFKYVEIAGKQYSIGMFKIITHHSDSTENVSKLEKNHIRYLWIRYWITKLCFAMTLLILGMFKEATKSLDIHSLFLTIYCAIPVYIGLHYCLFKGSKTAGILNINIAIYNFVLVASSLFSFYYKSELSQATSVGLVVSIAILWGMNALFDGIEQSFGINIDSLSNTIR